MGEPCSLGGQTPADVNTQSALTGDEPGWRNSTAAWLRELLVMGIGPCHRPRGFSVRPLPSNRCTVKLDMNICERPQCQTQRWKCHGKDQSQGGGKDGWTWLLWVFLWQCLSWLL